MLTSQWRASVQTAVIALLGALATPPLIVSDDSGIVESGWWALMIMLSTPATVLLAGLLAGWARRSWLATVDPTNPAPTSRQSKPSMNFLLGVRDGLAATAAGLAVGALIRQLFAQGWGGQLNDGTVMAFLTITVILTMGQAFGYAVAALSDLRRRERDANAKRRR